MPDQAIFFPPYAPMALENKKEFKSGLYFSVYEHLTPDLTPKNESMLLLDRVFDSLRKHIMEKFDVENKGMPKGYYHITIEGKYEGDPSLEDDTNVETPE